MEVQRQSKQLNENKESRNKQLLIYQRKFVVVRALGLKVTMAFNSKIHIESRNEILADIAVDERKRERKTSLLQPNDKRFIAVSTKCLITKESKNTSTTSFIVLVTEPFSIKIEH